MMTTPDSEAPSALFTKSTTRSGQSYSPPSLPLAGQFQRMELDQNGQPGTLGNAENESRSSESPTSSKGPVKEEEFRPWLARLKELIPPNQLNIAQESQDSLIARWEVVVPYPLSTARGIPAPAREVVERAGPSSAGDSWLVRGRIPQAIEPEEEEEEEEEEDDGEEPVREVPRMVLGELAVPIPEDPRDPPAVPPSPSVLPVLEGEEVDVFCDFWEEEGSTGERQKDKAKERMRVPFGELSSRGDAGGSSSRGLGEQQDGEDDEAEEEEMMIFDEGPVQALEQESEDDDDDDEIVVDKENTRPDLPQRPVSAMRDQQQSPDAMDTTG